MKSSSALGLLFFCIFCVVARNVEDFAEDIYEEDLGKVIHASVVNITNYNKCQCFFTVNKFGQIPIIICSTAFSSWRS